MVLWLQGVGFGCLPICSYQPHKGRSATKLGNAVLQINGRSIKTMERVLQAMRQFVHALAAMGGRFEFRIVGLGRVGDFRGLLRMRPSMLEIQSQRQVLEY